MKSKLIHHVEPRTFVLVCDPGDEVVEVLSNFANVQELRASHFTAIGALSDATVGFFDLQKKEYQPIEIDEQLEVASLIGNVAVKDDGRRMIHAHIVVGKRDGTAHVEPTLEIFLVESPAVLERQKDARTGLALIKIDE